MIVGVDDDNIGANTYQGSVYVFGPQLAFLPQPLPDGMNGVPYDVTLTATGGSAPYKFGLVGTLPQGLNLATDGTLSGTPTEEGTFEFRIMISDANGVSLVSEARMTILKSNIDPCSTIMIEPRTLPDGMVKKEYSEQMIATGGTEPYIFTVQGRLPVGLSLSTEGLLSGAPREVGAFEFRVQVTDATGCTPAFEYRLRIDKLNN